MAVQFSDINISSSQVGHDDLVYEIDAVRMSIFNILSTNQYDRVFRPDFFGALDSLLFEPMTEMTAYRIRNQLVDSISQWETRVVIDKVRTKVVPDYTNELYNVTLVYSVPSLDNKDFLNFNLSKGR